MPSTKASRSPPKRKTSPRMSPKKNWFIDNWFSLLVVVTNAALFFILIGKLSGVVETLQSDVSEIKARMVDKDTMDIQIKDLQNSIREQNLRITALEQRFMNGPNK